VRYDVRLASGRLVVTTTREDAPLPDLLDFATRPNPRRAFLFVSKVLGKHVPCRPRVMRAVHDRLADPLRGVEGPVLVVGMAETATGLGGAVADSLVRATGREDVLYQQTTRHAVDAPILVRFDEAHSHAPDQIVYAPQSRLERDHRAARTLVLVDDEVTTGRTLLALAAGLAPALPRLARVVLVSIVSWTDRFTDDALASACPAPLGRVHLVEGTFRFDPDPSFEGVLPGRVVAASPAPVKASGDTGRRAIRVDEARDRLPGLEPGVPPGTPLSVLGTGELALHPFLWAEALEERGWDVLVHGTTRSPIVPGGPIAVSLPLDDEHGEGVDNYLHNPPGPERRALVVYESEACASRQDLAARLGAEVRILPVAAREARP